jgi:uncharacterized protein (DUF952 family)
MTSSIFHIARSTDWVDAQAAGAYRVASLATEGFIHLSTRAQVLLTASRYYLGVAGLVLLEVNGEKLDSSLLRFESSTNAELFPHYYAALPVEAVVGVHAFAPSDDGSFGWPATAD